MIHSAKQHPPYRNAWSWGMKVEVVLGKGEGEAQVGIARHLVLQHVQSYVASLQGLHSAALQ